MDRESKQIMYGAFFSELESLQRNELYKIAGVTKVSMNPAGIGAGFKAWKAMGLGGGLSQLGQVYRGAGGGWKGIKALAANPMARAGALTVGGAGALAGGAGYLAGR